MSRRFTALMVAASALLGGCPQDDPEVLDNFDEPVSVTIGIATDPENPAAGNQPTAFVSDQGHREVARIDLQNRKIRTPLPLGRIPGSVAVHSTSGLVDQIYVADTFSGRVLALTVAGALAPTVDQPVFTDLGDVSSVELQSVAVRAGFTPTQAWTVEYDAGIGEWLVHGDGLGNQNNRAITGERYTSDHQEVSFTVTRTGAAETDGDAFTFNTDNSIRAIDVGGRAVDVVVTPDESAVLVTTINPAQLVAIDPATDATTVVALPGSVTPSAISFSPDGTYAFAADRGAPILHVVDIGSAAPASYVVTSMATPTASRQITFTPDERRAYLVANGSNEVFAFDVRFENDPPTITALDIVGLTPEVDAVPFPGGIRTIGAAGRVQTMRTGSAAYPVLVTTHAGDVRILNGNTGCQDFGDDRGARLDQFRFADAGAPSLPQFDLNFFATSKCGGVAQSETWDIVYNTVVGGYEVIGSLSDLQANLATEGDVYTSDRGEITFLIQGDPALPTTTGDTFSITITDGITPVTVGELPGDIAFFELTNTNTNETVEYALIANPGNDLLSQVDVAERRVTVTYR